MASNQGHKTAFEGSALKGREIFKAIGIARKNWRGWRAEFEGGGGLLLSDPSRFDAFCQEYSVGRTIRAGTRHDFRQRLVALLPTAVRDDTGRCLDVLEQELREDFGTREGRGRMISVLSKIAAFVRPERFVAWDRYAKRGVNIVLGRSTTYPFQTYVEYLAAFDCVWNGDAGQEIRRCLRDHAESALERKPQFQRRVLDVCLMQLGGRWND